MGKIHVTISKWQKGRDTSAFIPRMHGRHKREKTTGGDIMNPSFLSVPINQSMACAAWHGSYVSSSSHKISCTFPDAFFAAREKKESGRVRHSIGLAFHPETARMTDGRTDRQAAMHLRLRPSPPPQAQLAARRRPCTAVVAAGAALPAAAAARRCHASARRSTCT